jgi:hypothetical protein
VRNQALVAHIDAQWQADLADMSKISKENDVYTFLLTCVDVLGRYAWVIPVRSKSAAHMLAAMQQLFKQAAPRKPIRLQTDKGKEFYNVPVQYALDIPNSIANWRLTVNWKAGRTAMLIHRRAHYHWAIAVLQ